MGEGLKRAFAAAKATQQKPADDGRIRIGRTGTNKDLIGTRVKLVREKELRNGDIHPEGEELEVVSVHRGRFGLRDDKDRYALKIPFADALPIHGLTQNLKPGERVRYVGGNRPTKGRTSRYAALLIGTNDIGVVRARATALPARRGAVVVDFVKQNVEAVFPWEIAERVLVREVGDGW